jgi:diguanylate cyclase (GGDEF)-like protein/PAS domain S-box-containing protein
LAFQISHPTDRFPVPRAEVTGPVATFHQLQQLLEQSLRDLHAESHDLESAPDQALSEALQRLSGQLHHILAESTDTNHVNGEMGAASSLSALPLAPNSAPFSRGPIHVMTSCDGVVQMANDAAVDALGFDLANIGTMSLAEWIPYEEWQLIRLKLKAAKPPQEALTWLVNMDLSGTAREKVLCSVTPLLDHSRTVTAWHWDLREHRDSVPPHSFDQLIQGLETDLLKGQSLDESLKRICEGLVKTFGYPFVWIATVRESQRIQLRAQAMTSEMDWDAQGLPWWAAISRQEVLAQACVASEGSLVSHETPHTGEFSWFPSGFHLQEAYSLPLRHGDLSGLLVVCSKMPNGFDLSIREWLEGLGHLIERLVARGMEMEQLRLHSAVMTSVHDAVCVTDPHGRVEWVNQAYSKLLNVTPRQVLGAPLRSFPHAQLQEAWSNIQSSATEIGCVKTEVMEKGSHGESLVFEQVLTPLLDAEGQITHFVGILHDVTARAVAEMQMKHQAYHDALTDLPNRVLFEDRLQLALAQARRDGTLLALLFLDLDNFKFINDQYGHPIGDRLLRMVGKRLVTCVRTTDTVSRLSGDEFTIILQGLDRVQDIRQVAQKIVDCLTAPIHLDGQDIPVQLSIGIAVSPKDSTDPRRLLAIADQAMYRAKDFGGQRWYFATQEWNAE